MSFWISIIYAVGDEISVYFRIIFLQVLGILKWAQLFLWVLRTWNMHTFWGGSKSSWLFLHEWTKYLFKSVLFMVNSIYYRNNKAKNCYLTQWTGTHFVVIKVYKQPSWKEREIRKCVSNIIYTLNYREYWDFVPLA